MKSVVPVNYELVFEPDFKTFKFSGRENVTVDVKSPTSEITMHAAEIDVEDCHVVCGDRVLQAKAAVDDDREELIIRLPEKVKGRANIHLRFTGTHNDRLVGFYRAFYSDRSGKKKAMVTTQFEAADARRAFPCWDEPASKATFDVTIVADPGMDAISNMPVVSKRRVGRKNAFKFARTPVMSTYLLYLGVGEFDFLEGKLGKTKIRIVATRGNRDKCRPALEFTKQFLGYFQDYFRIPYPLPKLDMIAIPDFASGAMENWGAITFRETILLFDPKTSSTATKQHIAEVIAHELAHQWFGNLVTMKWWNDLWLNESFATFMATKAVAQFYPEWDMWDQFLQEAMNQALGLDSLKTSHPIEVTVDNPGQIREIFDDISYDKGGSVLRMLEDYIGEDRFRQGLRDYMNRHKYGNAVTNDLWEALSNASSKPVQRMMDTWVRQVGYPIIDARLEGEKLHLSQRRFLLERDERFEKGQWVVPLSIKTREEFFSRELSKREDVMVIDAGEEDWFKVNSGQRGVYRVKYDPESMSRLRPLVEAKVLPNSDRWGLQNDLWAMCAAGEVSVKSYLDFSRSYLDEDDYLVCSDVADALHFLYLVTAREAFWDGMKGHAAEYFSNIFERLGWDAKKGERHTDPMLRSYAIAVLGKLGNQEVIEEANRRFKLFLKKPDTLVPDLRAAVYSLVAWSGDERTYDMFLEMYRKARSQEEKIRYLAALGNFQQEELIMRSLDMSLSDEVRLQDLYVPIMKSTTNPYARHLLLPWMRKNWKTIAGKFGNAGNPLLNRIVGCLSVAADASKEREVAEMFRKVPVSGTEMKVAQTLERIRISSKLLERMRQEFSGEQY